MNLPPGVKSLSEIRGSTDPRERIPQFATLLEYCLKLVTPSLKESSFEQLIESNHTKFNNPAGLAYSRRIRNKLVHPPTSWDLQPSELESADHSLAEAVVELMPYLPQDIRDTVAGMHLIDILPPEPRPSAIVPAVLQEGSLNKAITNMLGSVSLANINIILDQLRDSLTVLDHSTALEKINWLICRLESIPRAHYRGLRESLFTDFIAELKDMRRFRIYQVEQEDAMRRQLYLKQQLFDDVHNLRLVRDRLSVELDIVKLSKDIEDVRHPQRPERPLTPAQQRVQDREACEEKIKDLKEEKRKALKIGDEDERIRRVNAIDSAIDREYERWGRLL